MIVRRSISVESDADLGRAAPGHPCRKLLRSDLQDETIGDAQDANHPEPCSTLRAVNEGATYRVGKLDENARTPKLPGASLRSSVFHRMMSHLQPDHSIPTSWFVTR
jgi:hypothetical protein